MLVTIDLYLYIKLNSVGHDKNMYWEKSKFYVGWFTKRGDLHLAFSKNDTL